ncbi:hypothetical protein POL68_02415 [Stigmatella sp. ncwal1]|uniref:Peptidylprolyl isomerase n=1 Tax=Stigmatella ashevillensis TaxID=2995309 RepID=A0ABT5D379_9BACT|nr:hypothetical protein [Stigmatella ashevillena]MDC0707313.1 hypothetical protein [Stigmatella ashevillena]
MKVALSSPRPCPGKRPWLLAGWLALVPVTAGAQVQGEVSPEPASAREEGRIVDRVVAIIEGQVLTLSELEFETRVALIQRGALQAAAAPLDEETLKGALELAINQRLQLLSADRLEAFTAEQAEVDERVAGFRDRFETEAGFQAFLGHAGADIKQLTEVLTRSVRAERILDSRIRPRAQVGEAELRSYHRQHASEYPEDYQAVKGRLREKLVRERYSALAAEELNQARASAQVRRVAPFAREARP